MSSSSSSSFSSSSSSSFTILPCTRSSPPIYLVQFAHRHLDFRRCEFESSLQLSSIPPPYTGIYIKGCPFDITRPFFKCHFPTSKIAKKVCSRCVLIVAVFELWGEGETMEDMANDARINCNEKYRGIDVQTLLTSNSPSWRINIQSFGWKLNYDEQNEIRQSLVPFLPFTGKVDIKNAAIQLDIIRENAVTIEGCPVYPRNDHTGDEVVENVKRPPKGCWFGLFLGTGNRSLVEKYDLKKRKYLGPTSMDNELSMIMCLSAQVYNNSAFVFDPFVGTGSILFSASVYGAVCYGTDIDVKVLKGKGSGNVMSNFDSFGLRRPEIVRSDNSMHDRYSKLPDSGFGIYDAIVTDPPYGIRAGARKSGRKEGDDVRTVSDEHRTNGTHIPCTSVYNVSDVMQDLLNVAAKSLVMGGHLVYLIPSMVDFVSETDLPRHPCLTVNFVCYQPLQISLGRRMIVMRKTVEYDITKIEEYKAYCWVGGSDGGRGENICQIREKISKINTERKREFWEENEKSRKEGKGGIKKAKPKRNRIEILSNTETEGAGVAGVAGERGDSSSGGGGGGVEEMEVEEGGES